MRAASETRGDVPRGFIPGYVSCLRASSDMGSILNAASWPIFIKLTNKIHKIFHHTQAHQHTDTHAYLPFSYANKIYKPESEYSNTVFSEWNMWREKQFAFFSMTRNTFEIWVKFCRMKSDWALGMTQLRLFDQLCSFF